MGKGPLFNAAQLRRECLVKGNVAATSEIDIAVRGVAQAAAAPHEKDGVNVLTRGSK